MDHRLS